MLPNTEEGAAAVSQLLGNGDRSGETGHVSQERLKWESRLERPLDVDRRALASSSQAETQKSYLVLLSAGPWGGQRVPELQWEYPRQRQGRGQRGGVRRQRSYLSESG